MCEHRALNYVSDSKNTWHFCLEVLVSFNSAKFVCFKSNFIELKALSEGMSASSNEDCVAFDYT